MNHTINTDKKRYFTNTPQSTACEEGSPLIYIHTNISEETIFVVLLRILTK
jgi:hypothetical protein